MWLGGKMDNRTMNTTQGSCYLAMEAFGFMGWQTIFRHLRHHIRTTIVRDSHKPMGIATRYKGPQTWCHGQGRRQK